MLFITIPVIFVLLISNLAIPFTSLITTQHITYNNANDRIPYNVTANTMANGSVMPDETWIKRNVHECRPVAIKVIHARSASQYITLTETTCAFDTLANDIVIGVWHSMKTESRIRWILDSWNSPNVVFLGDNVQPNNCIA